MKKRLLKYGGLSLLGLIVVIILQALGIIEPEEKETIPVMVTEQTTTI